MKRALWFPMLLIMAGPVMAQGDVAAVQSPSVAKPASSAEPPSADGSAAALRGQDTAAPAYRKPPSYMPQDLPEPKSETDRYWAKQRPTEEYPRPGKPTWEQSLDVFFDDTLPRLTSWCRVRVQQNPYVSVPLILGGMVTSYFALMILALIAGNLRRWRASVRLASERNFTRAERLKQMRTIMPDIIRHTQAKLKYEMGQYDTGQVPTRRSPSPGRSDVA